MKIKFNEMHSNTGGKSDGGAFQEALPTEWAYNFGEGRTNRPK